MNRYFKALRYDSLNPGKTLVVLGGVHGNERCGPEAVFRLIKMLDDEALVLTSGTLILVPVCNPEAYYQDVRYVDRNLNRYLSRTEVRGCYEDRVAPALRDVLDQADYVLDLHSYSSKGGPFFFLDTAHKEEADFALSLGVRDVVSGWADAYQNNADSEPDEPIGTTEYARLKGAYAVTLECGHHYNPDAPDVGFEAALRAISFLGMADSACAGYRKSCRESAPRSIKMRSVFYRLENGKMAKPFVHFDYVKRGELLAHSGDGTKEIRAPEDGYIALPKGEGAPGNEWFYFGVEAPLEV